MTEQIKNKILSIIPTAILDETGEWLQIKLSPEDWSKHASDFKHDSDLMFDYLFCLTCIDWKTHFTLVYHFTSTMSRESVVVKVDLTDRDHAFIASVASIWRTAEFHEREAYDLFGVHFEGHPDLRRLFLTDDWIGYPLRKDYEDPINMIKL